MYICKPKWAAITENNFIMERVNLKKEYTVPALQVVSFVVEHGFDATNLSAGSAEQYNQLIIDWNSTNQDQNLERQQFNEGSTW